MNDLISSRSIGRLPENEIRKFEEYPRWKLLLGTLAVGVGLVFAAMLIAIFG